MQVESTYIILTHLKTILATLNEMKLQFLKDMDLPI